MTRNDPFPTHNRVRARSAWYGPLALVLLALVAVMILALFFRVSEIQVVNASEYTDEEIIRASGIQEGANLFFVDRFSAASRVFTELPYMDTISIRRQLPNKIIIQAEGSAPVAWMLIDEEYWLIDRSGKLLGTVTEPEVAAYPEIRSLEPITVIAGEDMMVDEADERNTRRLQYLRELLTPLQAEGMLPYIQWIDLKNPQNPSLRLDDRIVVYLGELDSTVYKIALLRDVTEKLSTDDAGMLYYAGGNSWTFSPD